MKAKQVIDLVATLLLIALILYNFALLRHIRALNDEIIQRFNSNEITRYKSADEATRPNHLNQHLNFIPE